MPALQVRDFPDDLYAQLKTLAAQNHRSIAQQTVACVENELARQRFHASAGGTAEDDIEVPPNVRAAAERARVVEPWAAALEVEPEEVIQARRERRRRVLEEASKITWKGPELTPDDIAEMIREDREGRTNHVIESVLRAESARGDVQ